MTRHVRRASALILASALFSAGAWGQSTMLMQTVTGPIAVASEYFGTADGRELGRDVKGGMEPMVVLTVKEDPDVMGTNEIGAENVARITYTVAGGTFAETVSSSSLTATDAGDIQTEIISGGSAGDASVTIEVETREALGTGDTLTFAVPMLQATGAVLASDASTGAPTAVGVSVTASIAVRRSTDNPFPGAVMGTGLMGSIAVAERQVYDTMMPALSFAWEAPFSSTAEVDVTNRTVIISMGAMTRDPSAQDPSMAAAALRVGKIDIMAAMSMPKDLGGMDAAVMSSMDAMGATMYELGDGLSGDAVVTVSGPFHSGDMIYLGGKAMSIDGGMAMGSADIEMLLQSMGMDVIYVPGGVDDLKPSTFVGTAMLDFDDADNSASVSAGPSAAGGASMGMLAYKGFTPQGYAYGVVRGGGMDQSYVRIGCTSAGGCQIFLDCTDQNGMSYFGELHGVAGFGTGVASSDDIAAALGGGWSMGRGSCNLVSNAGLEVQHMVRSGHTLVNNSVVVNKAIAEVKVPDAPTAATYNCAPDATRPDPKGGYLPPDNHVQLCTPQ